MNTNQDSSKRGSLKYTIFVATVLIIFESGVSFSADKTTRRTRLHRDFENSPRIFTPPAGHHRIPVDDICKAANDPIHVVVIRLFDLKESDLKTSSVLHYDSEGHATKPHSHVAPEPKLEYHHTYVDFDAGSYLNKKRDVILVNIILDEKNKYFAMGYDSLTTKDDEDNGNMFCVKSPLYVGYHQNEISFYVKYVPPKGGKAVVGGYYFAVPNAKTMSFDIIDPNVKNSG